MIYMFLAQGFEEIEAIATADVLIRAGLCVKTVGIGDNIVTGAHGIKIVCDLKDDDVNLCENLQAVILPGGMPGTANLLNSDVVKSFLKYASDNEILICAICAAPMILGQMGLLRGRCAVCFPGNEKYLDGAVTSDMPVCRDGNFITAKGPGAAIEFGLEIVKALTSDCNAEDTRELMQCN
ncbi:MAG: DJ-1/PfpI family protein [Oscillospiraceae bacterium]|jgi:4-methyl-5(b-hydroxyethyl)-thiazole monophosphate biosynthesis|nr:DJ-1/PfpI family protein [Oscillospiraceae bacterium]